MQKLMQKLSIALGNGEDLVLATIISQIGSTPRQGGAQMIVFRDGHIEGTIGGGLVEAEVIKDAQRCFDSSHSLRRVFDLSNEDCAISDMICGGTIEILLEFIAANESNRTVFQHLLLAILSSRRATLVCPLTDGTYDGQRFVVDPRGEPSRADTSECLLLAIKNVHFTTSAATLIEHQGREYLISFFAPAGTVYLVGAGHVAVCTAEAAARVGFRVVVMDDRIEFANNKRFPKAGEIKVLPSFTNCFQGYEIEAEAYLVIVTRGHICDLQVLDQALRTDAGYIGMIGSHKKRKVLYDKLIDRGFSRTQLERVHCPIGVAIDAETPEEIAVSIVGELIYHRATGRKAWHLV